MKHKNNLSCARTGRSLSQTFLFALIFPLLVVAVEGAGYGQQRRQEAITTIHVDAAHSIKSFDPDLALGTSIDILPRRRGQDLHAGNPQGVSLRWLGADHLPSKYRAARRVLALEPARDVE